jgi:hypothetical protein
MKAAISLPDLDLLHLGLGLLQDHVQAADTVARVSVDALEIPLAQTFPDELADVHGHRNLRAAVELVGPRLPTSPRHDRFSIHEVACGSERSEVERLGKSA